MLFSGFSGYGKYDEIIRFDDELIPKTLLVKRGDSLDELRAKIKEKQISYPFVMKPNLGRGARDIVKIHNQEQLAAKIFSLNEEYLIQEFIDYPLEFGILYYRIP